MIVVDLDVSVTGPDPMNPDDEPFGTLYLGADAYVLDEGMLLALAWQARRAADACAEWKRLDEDAQATLDDDDRARRAFYGSP